MDQHKEIVKLVEKKYNPVSMFLYGSRARGDFNGESDYIVGVLYKKGNKISRVDLQALSNHSQVHMYPFEYESFMSGKIDTPFPLAIYYRELVESAKTISGEIVVEKMKAPSISTTDLLERINFDIGGALAAVLAHRNHHDDMAREEFMKSCLWGARNLVTLELKKFPLKYQDIYNSIKELGGIDEYMTTVEHAWNSRDRVELDEKMLYKNISLLNMVRERIKEVHEKKGDKVILE